MNFLHFGSYQQYSDLSRSILNKILLSERLLIEHIECLELNLNESELQLKKNEIFTLCPTTITFGTVAVLCQRYIPKEKFIFKTALTITFGSLSFLYSIKTFNKFRDKIIENSLDDFIKSLENFSNCIKRNIAYFNEIQTMRSMNKNDEENIDHRQTEKAWNCIRSIKFITELLYNKTRQLENSYEIPADFVDFYNPLEELQDCDYFKNDIVSFNSKNIKDFYNIFAYVQSQYLFRLALLAIQNLPLHFLRNDLSFLSKRIKKVIREDEKYFKNLPKETKKSNKIEISSLNRGIPYQQYHHHQQQHHPNNITTIILRDSSLKLSSCIYAVAEECQKLDNILQEIAENANCTENIKENEGKNLLEIANSMRAIENSLSVCCDDFHRLILVYNKFLNDKLKLQTNENMNQLENIENLEQQLNEGQHDEVNDNEIEEKFDDFYAFINDDEENNLEIEQTEVIDTNTELSNLDEKLTKKKFRPVLKQLRDRIDPIRQEMLEKEKKILQSKGIDVNKFLNDDDNNIDKLSSSSDSEGSFDEIKRKVKKRKNKNDAYEEMRQFLAQKDAINVFQLQLPTENVLEEEILE